MLNKYIIIVLLLLFIVNINLFSKYTLIIGGTQFNGNVSNINPYKLELALNFLSILKKDEIALIPSLVRDSLIKKNQELKIQNNLVNVGRELDADYLIFTRVNALKNLIRTDI